jgi:two-component sensor histidine kinase
MERGQPEVIEETLTAALGTRTYQVTKAPLRNEKGEIVGLFGVSRDITDWKKAEAHTAALTQEVTHRAKNLLTVVQAMARHSLRHSDPNDFIANFDNRLAALAASHDLLVSNKWSGIELTELAHAQLAFVRDLLGQRIHVSGPTFRLRPSVAQILGMAIHELTTNAIKYGALSNETGRVALTWTLVPTSDPQQLQICWVEHGGPPVTPPVRRGYGHSVIVRLVEQSAQASVALEYPRDGLTWRLSGPADAMTDTPPN